MANLAHNFSWRPHSCCQFQRKLLPSQRAALSLTQAPLRPKQRIARDEENPWAGYPIARRRNAIVESIRGFHQTLQGTNKALSVYQRSMVDRQAAIRNARAQVNAVQKILNGSEQPSEHCLSQGGLLSTIAKTFPQLIVPGIVDSGKVVMYGEFFTTYDDDGHSGTDFGYRLSNGQMQDLLSAVISAPEDPKHPEIKKGVVEQTKIYCAFGALLHADPDEHPLFKYCAAQKLDVSNVLQSGKLMVTSGGDPLEGCQFLVGVDDSLPFQYNYCFQKADLSNIQEALNKLVANLTSLSDQWTMRVQKLLQTYNYVCQAGSQIQTLGAGLTKTVFQNWK